MDNVFKYIGAGSAAAVVLLAAFKLILSPTWQHSILVFISIMLFATMALLVVSIYMYAQQLRSLTSNSSTKQSIK